MTHDLIFSYQWDHDIFVCKSKNGPDIHDRYAKIALFFLDRRIFLKHYWDIWYISAYNIIDAFIFDQYGNVILHIIKIVLYQVILLEFLFLYDVEKLLKLYFLFFLLDPEKKLRFMFKKLICILFFYFVTHK